MLVCPSLSSINTEDSFWPSYHPIAGSFAGLLGYSGFLRYAGIKIKTWNYFMLTNLDL